MRKLLALARRPVVWLSLIAFLLWLCYLRAVVPPPPACIITTGGADYDGMIDDAPSGWSELKAVADDGSIVTSVVTHSPGKWFGPENTHPHVWSTREVKEVTPSRWADVGEDSPPDWQVLWKTELWEHPEGRAFLFDELAWETLRERFPQLLGRSKDGDRFDRFAPQLRFSPDGRVLAYPSRDGQYAGRQEAEGITVEETRTGRWVAFLRGKFDRVHLAPGGQTAITRAEHNREFAELPRLLLWDLQTATVRSELRLPHDALDVRFTPDGRFVFANCWTLFGPGNGTQPLRWWDTASGRQVGEVNHPADFAFTTGGRVLVTKAHAEMQNGTYRPARLLFWDVETGESRGEWVPGLRSRGWEQHSDFVGSGGERYLAVEYDPMSGRAYDWTARVRDGFFELTTRKPSPKPDQVVVLDTAERREALRVPGKNPALSSNGRWLATVDEEGVIRVWEVPARLPWSHMLGLAVVLGAGTAVGIVLTLRLVRWIWRKRWRRWLFLILITFAVLAVALFWWDAAATDQGGVELSAVRRQLHNSDGLSEADLTAMIGRPPTVVPSDDGRPGVRHRWTAWGDKHFEVEFGSTGKTRTSSISDGRSMTDRLARWLGV